MNRDIVVLREAIGKLTQMLSGQGLTVTQRGARAFVRTDERTLKPKLVNIPSIPDDASPELILAIQGFIDHEVAHVLFTDWKYAVKAKKAGPKLHQMCNLVEDTFIERAIAKKFPGAVYNLGQLHGFFLDKITKPALAAAKSDIERFGILMVPLMRAWSGQRAFREFMDASGAWDEPLVKAFVDRVPKSLVAKIPTISSTAESYSISEELLEVLSPPPAPPEESEDEPGEEGASGKPTDKKDEKDKKTKSTKGEGTKEHEKPEKKPDKKPEPKPKEPSPEGESEEDNPAEDNDAEPDREKGGEESPKGGKPDSGEDSDDEEGGPGDGEENGGSGGEDSSEADEGSDDEDEGGGEVGRSTTSGADDGSEGEEDGDGEGSGQEEDGDEPSPSDGEASPGRGCSVDFSDVDLGKVDLESTIAARIQDEVSRSCRDASYTVYTKDLDKIEIYQHSGIDEQHVLALEEETRHMIGVMQKDIERMMAARSQSVLAPGFRSGRLHSAGLHRIMTGDDRLFRRKMENNSKDTAVCLLVDNSGSMGGKPMKLAMEAAFALSMTLERVRIAHECIGFTTTEEPGGYKFSREAEDEAHRIGMRNGWTRYEPLYMPIYKGYEERLTPAVKKRLVHAAIVQRFLRNNVDGECVEIATQRLVRRRETRKVLIVLSDGSPACATRQSMNLNAHLHRAVAAATKAKIDVVGIGIMDHSVRTFYPKHLVINKVEELPKAVMGELRRALVS